MMGGDPRVDGSSDPGGPGRGPGLRTMMGVTPGLAGQVEAHGRVCGPRRWWATIQARVQMDPVGVGVGEILR